MATENPRIGTMIDRQVESMAQAIENSMQGAEEPKVEREQQPDDKLKRGKRSKERGPARYYYTSATIAKIIGKSQRTVRRLGLGGKKSAEKSAAALIELARLIAKAQGWI